MVLITVSFERMFGYKKYHLLEWPARWAKKVKLGKTNDKSFSSTAAGSTC